MALQGQEVVQHRATRTPFGSATVPARILIAGDHPIFRDGLKRLLEAEPGLHVIGEAGDGAATLQLVRQLTPDLLLFDLAMPDAGLDILRALAATSKLPRTIVLTGSMGTKELLVALKLGVLGIVRKESTTRSLCESIYGVLNDQYALAPEQVGDLRSEERRVGKEWRSGG